MPFKPGQSGNPKGRPKGARSKFAEEFLKDLLADWQEHGAEAIRETRLTKPEMYLRVAASVVPKDHNINLTDERGLDDYSLAELLALRNELADIEDAEREGKSTSVH